VKHWLMMFRPETYADVKAHGTIGVRAGVRKLLDALSVGDRFVAYLSRVQQLDGTGTVAGAPFVDHTPIFAGDKPYEHRCKVSFDTSGHAQPVGDTLWTLSCFPSEMKTTPTNYALCKGGIVAISAADFELLVRVMKGDEAPTKLPWKAG